MSKTNISFLDCTLRDGGYINNWRFNKEFIDNFKSNFEDYVDYIEIGFANKTKNYKDQLVGDLRNLDKDSIEGFSDMNTKKVIMADFKDINVNLLKDDLNVDLVRIAFHKQDLEEAIDTCKVVKSLGYRVSVNAMAITNYDESEINYLLKKINEYNLDVLYIADSYGSLNQEDIHKYLINLNDRLNPKLAIGFHLHNNMNNAYSNYERLLTLVDELNISREIIIDSTIFGMGRGAGNLQTELVIINKFSETRNTSNHEIISFDKIVALLKFIQKFIKPIYKVSNNYWGYDLDYLASGYLKMHPNYIVKMRDLGISMENRFFIIQKMIENKVNYKYFDKSIIENMIQEFKLKLL